MKSLWLWTIVLGVLAMSLAYHVGAADNGEKKVNSGVFELRTYHAAPGKMDALHARFCSGPLASGSSNACVANVVFFSSKLPTKLL